MDSFGYFLGIFGFNIVQKNAVLLYTSDSVHAMFETSRYIF